MKRKYQFYDKEEVEPREWVFDLPVPFEANLNEELKDQFGPFLALVDHVNRIIRIHSAYDSGKGTRIIDPVEKPRKERLDRIIRRGLQQPGDTYAFPFDDPFANHPLRSLIAQEPKKQVEYPLVLIRRARGFHIFRDATIGADGTVSGYTQGFQPVDFKQPDYARLIDFCLRVLGNKRILAPTIMQFAKSADPVAQSN